MSQSRISELGSIIACSSAELDNYLCKKGITPPSFQADSTALPADPYIAKWRQTILEATDELHALMLGPIGILTTPAAICRFDLANSFPHGQEEATFADIAAKSDSGLSQEQVGRLIRHAASYWIFCEPRKGVVAHTAASKLLAVDPLLRQWISMVSEEMWPAATKTVDAIAAWHNSEEPHHSGFNLSCNTTATVFEEISKNPQRLQRYADAMSWFGTGPGLEPVHVINGFEWGNLLPGSLIVDVGGSYGSFSIAIAEQFPLLRCIIQDHQEIVDLGQAQLPAGMETRVIFMGHDFFDVQPIKNANVFLLRWILHDWSDKYAVTILRALIPALQSGTTILVVEHILPEPDQVSVYRQRAFRSFDIAMMEFHNAKERDLEGWTRLFHVADPRFKLVRASTPPGSRLGVLVFVWTP